MDKKNLIVAFDFTPIGEIALNHALVTAKPIGATVYLLNVVETSKDVAPTLERLKELIANLNTSVEVLPIVRIGSIFDDIANVAEEQFAELIFMGTHGAKGWQHIVGSHALRVVTSSSIPFIITQERDIRPNGFQNIVVPLDLAKETKQKLVHVANLAKYFDSKIHIITPREKDPSLTKIINDNIALTKNFLDKRDIDYTTEILDPTGFDKQIVKYAVRVDADLIAIMNLNQPSIFGLIAANYEQYIITNDAKIPTLIVNPLATVNKTFFLTRQ